VKIMEFQSLEQLRRMFGISATEPEGIRREIRSRLREVHPDALTGAGLPENDAKREEVLQLTAALDFLDRPDVQGTLVPVEPMTELVKIVRDLVQANQGQNPQAEEQEAFRREREAEQALSQQSDARVEEIRTAGRLPVISLTAVSTLLTVLWILPTIVQRNLVLGNFIDVNSGFFAAVWLASLFITAATWVFFKWRAQGEEQFQRALNLESTQNLFFNSFLRDLYELTSQIRTYQYSPSSEEGKEKKRRAILAIERNPLYEALRRSDESEFLGHRPSALADVEEWISREGEIFSYSGRNEEFQKADFVSYVRTRSMEVKGSVAERTGKQPLLLRLFFSREPIDDELAHNVADLILARAEAKGIVREIQTHSLDKRYSREGE
jgi:hypothetical protein